MKGMRRPVCRLWLCMLLCLPALARADCEAARAARIDDDRLHLPRPDAGHSLVGWIRLAGADWRLELDGAEAVVWPPRYGSIPLHLRAGDREALGLSIQHLWGPQEARPLLDLHCVPAGSDADRRFARLAALAAEHATVAEGAEPLRAARLVAQLAVEMFRQVDRQEALDWLAAQQLGLAMLAGLPVETAAWADWIGQRAAAQGDRRTLAQAVLRAGQARYLSDRPRAWALLQEAERRFESLGDRYFAAVARQEACLLARLDGDLEQADRCYLEVIAVHSALAEYDSLLRVLLNRMTALTAMGRLSELNLTHEQARTVAEQARDPALIVAMTKREAQSLTWRGEFESALALLREAREHHDRVLDLLGSATTDNLIGANFRLAGEPARAVEYYLRAEQRLEGSPHAWMRVRVRLSLALSLAQLGRHAEAITAAQAATRELEEAGDELLQRDVWAGLAEILLDAGRAGEARQALGQLPERLEGRQRLTVALLRARAGEEGRPADPDWAEELERALDGDQLLLALRIGEQHVARQIEGGDGEGALATAGRLMQRVAPVLGAIRAPALRDSLAGSLHRLIAAQVVERPPGALPAELGERLRLLLVQLARASQSTPGLADENLLLALERRVGSELLAGGSDAAGPRALHLQLAGSLAGNGRAGRSGPGTERFPPLQLDGPHARLAWPLFGRDAAGWLVFDGDAWSWWPIDAPALRALRPALLEALAEGHADSDRIAALGARLDAALGMQRWLAAGVDAVWVGAHGELAALPLELALPADHDTAIGWVLSPENVALDPPRRLWALGAASRGSGALPALDGVAPELQAVAARWPQLPTAQLNVAANREMLGAALSEPGALVHIASHGRASSSRFEESGLWLADADGRPQFVSAYRLRSLPGAAALLVLSACESGQGAMQHGIGLGSVASAASEAGAQRVIGARWAVGDRAALRFADALHGELARAPGQPARALHRAQRALRAQPAFRNPGHWAAWFVLLRGVPAAPGVPDA